MIELHLALWIFGIQSTMIIGLVITLWTLQQKRLKKMQEDLERLYTSTDFAAFKADYLATRDGWRLWRGKLEDRLDEHAREIKENSEGIARILGRLNGSMRS